MPLYRLELGQETFWITADTDEGALALTAAHIDDEDSPDVPPKLTNGAGETLALDARAEQASEVGPRPSRLGS